ncbi:hypothetical protein ASC94_15775 [Massilia sp. Root418]|uniref:DUF1566 domain-containing protein n=1 Tax=Massilia sp. Root418 TaxID=1736532 RepID=UPI0006FA4C3C|nr:DUF1566 domain-containing protein [Massilia sp. Root418]KQW94000.1 hypothetical protein ASC94_15775 [Massilia sp. Root418]
MPFWIRCAWLAAWLAAHASQAQPSWTTSDSGRDVNWEEAKAFCAGQGAGWRLPRLEELSGLYSTAQRDGNTVPCGNASCMAPPALKLSGNWYWSSSDLKKDSAESSPLLAWGVLLVNGSRNQTFKFMPHGARALCVRD